jgi:Putative transposase
VIKLLRAALGAGQLTTGMSFAEMETILALQEERTWIIKVQSLGSKEHFLRYAGRYVRRPPIAPTSHHLHRRAEPDLLDR